METGAAVAGQSTTFDSLSLAPSLMQGLTENNFTSPTPIQAEAIPYGLKGLDVLGIARTGTGKTAAFVLPMMNALVESRGKIPPRHIRALILAPTRELAVQIDDAIRTLGKHTRLRSFAVLGGVGRRPQVDRLFRGVDIVVGTPGRINDLMSTGELRLDLVSHFVLDEADQMLDFGFIHDVRKIANALPQDRQSMLFSATMPPQVASLAQTLLTDPVRVEVARAGETPAKIDQHVYFVEGGAKQDLLVQLLEDKGITRTIVFTRTKHGANRLSENLFKAGIRSEALHGNKSQAARQKSLDRFRAGESRVLIATDIAARGIDIPAVSHVINYDIPNVPESYVHRIGRTARNGASGIAVSFCASDEAGYLRDIQRLTGNELSILGGDWPTRMPKRGAASQGRRPPQQRDGQSRSFGDRAPRGDRPFGDRPQREERSFGDRAPRGDRPFGDRPQREERSFGDRPNRGDRPFGDRPQREERAFGDRAPRGDRPFGDRAPRGDRPFGDRPQREERSFGDRAPRGDRPFGDRPQREERSFGDRPNRGDRPFGDRAPRGDRPFGDRPQREERSFGDRAPRGDRPFGDRPQREGRSFGDRPQGDRPFGDRAPRGDRPFGDRPQREGRSFGDRPQGDRPFGERSERSFGDKPARRENMPRPFKGKGEFGADRPQREDRPYRAADHGDRPVGDRPMKAPRKDFGDRPQGEKKSFGGKKGFGDKTAFSKLRKTDAA